MPVSTQWDNEEKTALRYDLEGEWTWDEFHTIAEDGKTMRREVTHTVDIIANLDNSIRIPPNALSQMKQFTYAERENKGLTIIAGGGGFTIALVRVYTRVFKSSQAYVRVFRSLAEARQFITEKSSIKE